MRPDLEADRIDSARALSRALTPYEASQVGPALWQLVSTVVPFAGLWLAMLASLDGSYWLTALLTIPAAGFLVRLFMIQHDCAHRSFLPSPTVNDALGTVIGFVTLTPHAYWRRLHLIHHATSGNLDRRGYGDLDTLTVAEYRALTPWGQLRYRLYRHPLVLFGIAPTVHFVLLQRWCTLPAARWRRERRSVHLTNAAIVCWIAGLSALIGVERVLLVQGSIMLLASSIGMWLFYVQHQFEDTYWDRDARWDAVAAGVHGSSYYRLPRPLEWLTCRIGLHHVHHLSPRIPNYRLRRCLDENPALQQAPVLTLVQSFRCAALKLWDEERRRLVPFRRDAPAPK